MNRPQEVRPPSLWWLASLCVLLAGCRTNANHAWYRPEPVGVVDPACCQVARELNKTSLPEYRIEPPDLLLIEAVNNLRLPGEPLRAGDPLAIQVSRTFPVDSRDDPVATRFKQIDGVFLIRSDGCVDLGPEYGLVRVSGMTLEQAREAVRSHLARMLVEPKVGIVLAEPRSRQHISGEHLVRPDGTISLGIYGSVYISGSTVGEAKQEIERHLKRHIQDPEISIDVLAYNSKVYYVITDGAGSGEQVFRFSCTGNETVLDAISHVNGLPVVASRKHIWIARPAPADAGYEQILKVDWNAIVRNGSTETNYQVLPGDRLYVRADELISFDTFIAKVTAPFERIFGFALLGNGTVRAIQNGNRGGGGGSGL